MRGKTVLVMGSSNTDMIIKLDRIPQPGETLLGGRFMTAAGGKGANQAVGAAKAGGEVTFIARIGRDMFGDTALAGFLQAGINVDHVVRDPSNPSGVAMIFVASNGENSIAVASGANAKLSPGDVAKANSSFVGAGVLVVQLETPLRTVQAAAELAAQVGVPVILNPAPACSLPDKLLKNVTIITPNETEAEMLTGIKINSKTTASRAADALLIRGVKTVIITLGSRGSFFANGEGRWIVPGFKVKAVDTTAAGDIFNGSLAVALVEGKTMESAVRFANAAAAISVTRMGAQVSAPAREEIEDFIIAANRKSGAYRTAARWD